MDGTITVCWTRRCFLLVMEKKDELRPHPPPFLLMVHSPGCLWTLDQTLSILRIANCVPLEGRSGVIYQSMGQRQTSEIYSQNVYINFLLAYVFESRYYLLDKKI